jgi:hypothetical protein
VDADDALLDRGHDTTGRSLLQAKKGARIFTSFLGASVPFLISDSLPPPPPAAV